jgi:ribose transport system substrate-binding protein
VLVTKRHRTVASVATAMMIALLATACGSSSSSSSSSGSSGTASNAASSSGGTSADLNKVVVPGVPTLAQLYKGTYGTPPSTSPPPAKGKKIWWIACDLATPSCALPAATAGQAAKALGMNFHVADGKFNVGGGYDTAIRTALATHPDAILLYGVACEPARAALQEAKAAGVMTTGGEEPDCSEDGTGPQLFSVHMKVSPLYPTAADVWKGFGAYSADYIIDASGGHAKIIDNAGTEPLQHFVDEGFTTELKKCSGCSIVDSVSYNSTTLTPNGPWAQAFRSALTQHPEATAVYFPFDLFASTLGGAKAVAEQSGGRKIITFGGQCAPDGMALLMQGKLTAETACRSVPWSALAELDTINRALNGKPSTYENYGYQLVTPGHNESGGKYTSPTDFEAAYYKAWGVSK